VKPMTSKAVQNEIMQLPLEIKNISAIMSYCLTSLRELFSIAISAQVAMSQAVSHQPVSLET